MKKSSTENANCAAYLTFLSYFCWFIDSELEKNNPDKSVILSRIVSYLDFFRVLESLKKINEKLNNYYQNYYRGNNNNPLDLLPIELLLSNLSFVIDLLQKFCDSLYDYITN